VTSILEDIDILGSSRTRSGAYPRIPAAPETLAQTGEYSIFGLTRAVDQSVVRGRQVGFTLMLFGIATIVAVLYSIERYFYSRFVGEPVALTQLVPAELIFTYAWALLTPLVMFVARRYPVWGNQRARNWIVQVAAMVAFVVVHVTVVGFATVAVGVQPADSLSQLFSRYLLQWTVLDAIVFCMLVSIHHAIVYYRVSKDRTIRASQLEARLAQSQLQMLRMQLQPHFLFNTLHSISALMHKDVRRADSMIVALSDLLRMSLQNIGAQEVPLQSELDFLQRYLEIMEIRFQGALHVETAIEADVMEALVPNLILQPIVENALEHGVTRIDGSGHVEIGARRSGDQLILTVRDNGPGLVEEATSKEGRGLGLRNTRARLAQLYGGAASFTLAPAPAGGVIAQITLPLHTAGDLRTEGMTAEERRTDG
jgi:two-component system LytT family sensor kinase